MPTVLITGAASGIGRSTAERFSSAGWRCVLVDQDAARLSDLMERMGGRHRSTVIDLTESAQIVSLSNLDEPIDALVNNAGSSDDRGQPLVDQSPLAQSRLLNLNLYAPFAVLDALRPLFREQARVVNVASGAGLRAIPFRGYYSPSKAGLIAGSQVAAADPIGPVINTICPGFVRTDLVDALIQSGRLDPRRAVARIPLGRMADPGEMANAIFFLAGVEPGVLSGETLRVCGGSSVYGGSRDCEPARLAPLPQDSLVTLHDRGPIRLEPSTVVRTTQLQQPLSYRAMVDSRPLEIDLARGHARSIEGIPPLLWVIHQAVSEFAMQYRDRASLTLMLPREEALGRDPWSASEHAAARMLVSTLACELADRALRVNAIEVDPRESVASLSPLIHFLAGARAQFVTGQILRSAIG